MKKNVASQKIGCQMVTAADGSAFTGSVTVYVTGDAGTQAVGSVSSGACTHEGNGYHTYAPAQAETNYDLVAFTFTGSGAIPATVQIFTNFPQTGDSYTLASSSGVAVNLNLVQNPSASLNLSGTTIGSLTSVATGGITAGSIAADAIGASELAADAVAEIADAVWDEATTGHVTSGTFGEQLKTDVDAILADTGTDGVVLNWNTIQNQSATVTLSGTTVKTATDVETDTADIQSRLPAALGANGNIKADVRDFSGTAGTFSGGRPEVNASHAAGTAWNSGAITASTIATGAIDADAIASDAVTEIQSGLATASALTTVGTNVSSILDDTGTSGVVVASLATGSVTAAALHADAANEIADAVLSRNASNTEGSAGEHTLTGVILAHMEGSVSGTTWTIKKTDGSTTFATKTVTTSASADPITGVT